MDNGHFLGLASIFYANPYLHVDIFAAFFCYYANEIIFLMLIYYYFR